MERGRQADCLFKVLRRFAKDRKVPADDYAALAPFVSDNFRRPSFIDALDSPIVAHHASNGSRG